MDVNKKNRRQVSGGIEKLNQQMKDEMVEFILLGYPFSEILDYFGLNYNLSHDSCKALYQQSVKDILDIGEFDFDQIIMQHVYYYEEAIRFFDSINNYSAKAKAMIAKEKLLKIYEQDEPVVEVENNVNINIEQLQFDVNKLDTAEKERFQQIFNKVKFVNENK